MAILRGKGDSGLTYSRIDEIPVIRLPKIEKCRKVNLISSSCEGVLFKNSKIKTGGPPVYHHRLFELSIDPS